MDWFDKEAERLEDELERGDISQKEFYREMRDLRAELEGASQEAAEQAYHDYIGY